GTKHGNIQILGAVSYGAPLFSTVLLIVFGKAEATPTVIVGGLMIVAGALVASREMVLRSRR
ncbi:MAG TPA: EamA family transporter, partial [Thalassospira lucentensis]|nr:EamA family transporter [Thalassospira lucentensis]